MIQSFRDKATRDVFERRRAKSISRQLQLLVHRKLIILDAAEILDDLRVPPGNRLEKLGGDKLGQYSIRVNDQYRICFTWREGHAFDVQLADHH